MSEKDWRRMNNQYTVPHYLDYSGTSSDKMKRKQSIDRLITNNGFIRVHPSSIIRRRSSVCN